MIAIYVISFNNGYYVKNTVDHLVAKGVDTKNVHVLDNASTGTETVNVLKELEERRVNVVRFPENRGHLVWQSPEIWDNMPEYFVVTDPDLQFNENLPNNFLETLKEISDLHEASRVGFALSLEEKDEFYTGDYCLGKSIYEWEIEFWKYPRESYDNLDLYDAGIDTTFFLGCKSRFTNLTQIRVGSNFTAKHLPWSRKSNSELGVNRLKEMYSLCSKVSTSSKLVMNGIRQVNKRDESFYVQIDNSTRDAFWLSNYSTWENETFDVFDEHVNPNTIVLDIGAWIGPTVLYLSSLGAEVIAVEADKDAANVLRNNINLNQFHVKVIEKAIYKDNHGVYFGENLFRNDGMNASTSQIVTEHSGKQKYKMESLTFVDLLKYVDKEISLIKVDIEGGEEHILKEVLDFSLKNNVPAYISFHLTWWSEEGKTNFRQLFEDIFLDFGQRVDDVLTSPFTSILFSKNVDKVKVDKVIKIYYGVEGKYTDVTSKAVEKCLKNGIIEIPKTEFHRANVFGDPLFGTLKHIKYGDKIYTAEQSLFIDYNTKKVVDIASVRKEWWEKTGKLISDDEERLKELHKYISLSFGAFHEEFPEQLMAMRFIKETDSVLEIGANVGRNTCIIASILNDDRRLVSLECCQEYAKQLEMNRDQNGFHFQIEVSALSQVPLIQKGWDTFISEIVFDGYKKVETVSFSDLEKKYGIKYNVLVADCEGALYQILKDEPRLLENIELVIIENDFRDIVKKNFVDAKFAEQGLQLVHSQPGGWGPCQGFFFQVFSKR